MGRRGRFRVFGPSTILRINPSTHPLIPSSHHPIIPSTHPLIPSSHQPINPSTHPIIPSSRQPIHSSHHPINPSTHSIIPSSHQRVNPLPAAAQRLTPRPGGLHAARLNNSGHKPEMRHSPIITVRNLQCHKKKTSQSDNVLHVCLIECWK